MKRNILIASLIITLIIAIGLADKGLFVAAGCVAAWPVFVMLMNLVDAIRREGWA